MGLVLCLLPSRLSRGRFVNTSFHSPMKLTPVAAGNAPQSLDQLEQELKDLKAKEALLDKEIADLRDQ